ncbi:DUF4248 domain-containing protein [uncultured Parabacteroides sp.]|uniref:DUF4248 domain-containing protein n=1 Tax=uncultured Parabacteroides sp. TaxID=512312 RepID=UPI00261A83ED|nr:DUF4248 domain-containing protein [uncultured Parabacteroides sp.]
MSLPLRKSDLAVLYFPELASHQACNRLRRWIVRCTELHDRLREAGYRSEQRIFTPRQVGLIVRFLGEP